METEKICEYFKQNKFEILGTSLGLISAFGILFLGFFKFLFISICMFVGYYLGYRLKKDPDYLMKIWQIIYAYFKRMIK